MTQADEARPHRAWALWLLLPLMAFGIAASAYMARHHEIELYGGEDFAAEELVGCVESDTVSCDIVNTSAWSEVLGVPTFAWAIPTYLLVALLAVLAARGQHRYKPILILVGVGTVAFSGFLYWVSVTQLGKVCMWCMRLYGVNALTLLLAAISGVRWRDLPTVRELGVSAGVFLTSALLVVGGQQTFRAQLLAGTPDLPALPSGSEDVVDHDLRDPEGPAPALSFDVTTEDGNPGTFALRPGDAWKGNPDAKVAIVEFADFECGYCKRAGFQLRRLYEAYKDDVVFVYKHFPLDPSCNEGVNNKRHRYACVAHMAASCAQEQGRFWAYHDLLYKNNHQLRDEHLTTYAETVGLDMTAWGDCMTSGRGMAKVRQDGADGKAIDIHGTPRVWIDGTLYRSGSSAEQMARAIEIALGHRGVEAAENAAKMRESGPDITPIPADVPPMRHIQHGRVDVWMDTFEAGATEGVATVGKHQIPGLQMSWFAARDACEEAGKRLCTEEEWIAACQSAAPVDDDHDGAFADDLIEGNAYPYGDFHTPGLCWEDKRDSTLADGRTMTFRPVYTGEMPGCVTADGVYDMTGNVEEWVGATEETAVLLGGAFDTQDDKARCYRRNDTFGAGYANRRTGFRCCSERSP